MTVASIVKRHAMSCAGLAASSITDPCCIIGPEYSRVPSDTALEIHVITLCLNAALEVCLVPCDCRMVLIYLGLTSVKEFPRAPRFMKIWPRTNGHTAKPVFAISSQMKSCDSVNWQSVP